MCFSTRLLGLGVLSGVVASEALYGSSAHFRPQTNLIMDAVVSNIISASMESLDEEYVGIFSSHNVSNDTSQDGTDQG
jgi:hypothetical protein